MTDYRPPVSSQLAYDFDGAPPIEPGRALYLSHKDVLGLVQSALEELGSRDPALIALKRAVFEEVVDGRLAEALRTAIVGAGRAGHACDG
jgi:hypothetical protein